MKRNNNIQLISFIALLFITFYVNDYFPQQFLTNPSHLNHLYKEITINEREMGIIHIYSEYPDYHVVADDDEGIACVDDVSRAAVFYAKYYKLTGDSSSLHKVKTLTEFLLYMQSDSGWFNNFILKDYSINKTHKNSVAEPNWWTWRALWALSENYLLINETDAQLSERVLNAIEKTIIACKNEFSLSKPIVHAEGFKRPSWLPFQSASDQASVLVLGLINYYKISKDQSAVLLIEKMCDGILLMQEGNENIFPFGAFLSWENIWHAYGNSQSYALLKAYQLLNNTRYKTASLLEINNFFSYLIEQQFLNEIIFSKFYTITLPNEIKTFPQIAYGIRPMVFALLSAYELENDKKYFDKALNIASWFFGSNYPKIQMYDTSTGRCFDGITGIDEINMNSGAESTIEALLSLIEIEKHTGGSESLKELIKSME
ncbi:MAG: hypothetical protein HXY50_14275 [Ignavibacteriaceae bacterium]|nr:hypothetical protein [Ignavibacteriaceae bacterium]